MIAFLRTILICCLSFAVYGQEKELTLESIFLDRLFPTASLGNWKWIPGEDAYAFFHDDTLGEFKSIFRVELATGDTTILVSGKDLVWEGTILDVSDFWFSNDGEFLLLQIKKRHIWRRSHSGIYFVYYPVSREIILLAEGKELRNVKFSPDNKKVAYVKADNNLYVFYLKKNKEKRLTRDGSEVILNGHRGWLYEEEFGSFDGYRWSPNGKKILYWREDQSQVKKFPYLDETQLYPEIKWVYYPKVGERNPLINIGVVSLRTGWTKWLDLGNEEDMYFPGGKWSGKDVIITRLNRKQNHLELLKFNLKSGKGGTILDERDSAWVDVVDDLFFMEDASFLKTTELSGYRHINYYDATGHLKKQITEGEWEVRSIVDVDEENGKIYFTGNKSSVLENQFYSVNMDGSGLTQLTSETGWHTARMSPTKNYFIDSYSSANLPLRHLVKKSNGNPVRILKETDLSKYKEYNFTYPEFFTFTTSDGVVLNVKITLPHGMDVNKQHPVIIHGYGLAGSQMVTDRWGGSNYLWHQFMTQKGYLILSVDNRQTGGRGKAFKNLGYGDLGKWLIHDHIEVVKYLGNLAYVDTSRIGVWGWSGGGYFTALALTKGADYFKTGVAVAPVTDWRLYDSAYTERYMGLLSENGTGYDSASVFSYIDKFKGKLLVIHGTGDDNVHSQNTLQLINKFIDHNKQIDMFLYPNSNHRIYGKNTSFHLYKRISDYFLDNL